MRRSRPGQLGNCPSTCDHAHPSQAAGCEGWASVRPGRPRRAGSPRTQNLRKIIALLRGNSQSRQFHPFRMCKIQWLQPIGMPALSLRIRSGKKGPLSFLLEASRAGPGRGQGQGPTKCLWRPHFLLEKEPSRRLLRGRAAGCPPSLMGWGLGSGGALLRAEELKAPGVHAARQPEVLFIYLFFFWQVQNFLLSFSPTLISVSFLGVAAVLR